MDDNLALSTTSHFAHSDTLFAALVNGHSALNGGAEDFIGLFKNGAIKISSLFYYLHRNGQYVYFLPKPVFLHINSPKLPNGKHKLRNKVKFVSIGIWNNDEGLNANNWTKENGGYKIVDKLFVLTDEEYEMMGMDENSMISNTVLSPKSPQRAHAKDLGPFYQSDISVGTNKAFDIGWYFIYSIADDEIENNLIIAANVMAYSGIGGERHTTGRTVPSKPEPGEIEIREDAGKPKYFTNLSLFCPEGEGDFKKAQYYTTLLRGGRKTPFGQAQVIRMIEEGALLTEDVTGRMEEIGKDEHERPIYRLGIPLTIPFYYEKS